MRVVDRQTLLQLAAGIGAFGIRLVASTDVRLVFLRDLGLCFAAALFAYFPLVAIIWQWLRLPVSQTTLRDVRVVPLPSAPTEHTAGPALELLSPALLGALFLALQLLKDLVLQGAALSWGLLAEDVLVAASFGCVLSALMRISSRLVVRRAIEKAQFGPQSNNSLEPCPKCWHAKPATRTAAENGDSSAH